MKMHGWKIPLLMFLILFFPLTMVQAMAAEVGASASPKTYLPLILGNANIPPTPTPGGTRLVVFESFMNQG